MFVEQACNVLRLIEFFAWHKQPAKLADISRELGWPRSSTFNLLGTLVDCGFLYEPVPRRGYYPTTRWLILAQEIAAAEPIPSDIGSLLRSLVNATGETAFLAAPAGTYAVLLDAVEPRSQHRYFARTGRRLPIHATAAGRAILAQYSRRERTLVLKKIRFECLPENALLTIEGVENDIAQSLSRGWFENIEGFTKHAAGVAIPLAVKDRRLAVVVCGPASRVTPHIRSLGQAVSKRVSAYLLEASTPALKASGQRSSRAAK